MTTKDYYKELERIVQTSRPNYWLRMKCRLFQWLCKTIQKCLRRYISDENKTKLEMAILHFKQVPFQAEVLNPLNEAMKLIGIERNLGNYLAELTRENAHPESLLTHSEIFDIISSFPSIKVHNNLARLYPNHYQQLVACLDTRDKIHFVNYTEEQHLNLEPLRNLCSYFLMESRMSEYTGDLSMKEFKQLGAEIHSMAMGGEMKINDVTLKLADVFTDSSLLCDCETITVIEKMINNLYVQNLMNYFLYQERLNTIEQHAIEAIAKKKRYIKSYNTVFEVYRKIIADNPKLKEQALQAEQTQILKPLKPLEEPSTAIIYSYQMPQAPDKIDKKQIFLLADELINEGFINKEDGEKFIYFLQGSGGRYKEPLAICWHDKYHSLKYLLQFGLYTDLPDNTNATTAENFIFKKAKGYGNYGEQTLRTCTKSKILQEIDNEKKEKLDEIMAKLKL